jgi:hypothetical protein
MGHWGTGLYAGDFAMDLRSTIGAVARLPFAPERLVEILCETEPGAANNALDEDHATFWLVLADQFAKRGIVSDRVRETALAIIDADDDITMLERLGMKPSDIRKRRRMLSEIRTRIETTVEKPRTVLAKPQPLVMEIGDVIAYPTCRGRSINPYYPSKERDTQYTENGPKPWTQDGWGVAVIVDCGRAFDFLSWYRPLVPFYGWRERPSLQDLMIDTSWKLEIPGTCSPSHFRKMEMAKLAAVPVDGTKVDRMFPDRRPKKSGISAAVNDISIANRLRVIPADPSRQPSTVPVGPRRIPTITNLAEILSDSR